MKDLIEAVKIVSEFAERVRESYFASKNFTNTDGSSCETIRVPVALLNRIRDAQAEAVKACNLHDALLEYFKAATSYNNTVGHEDATVEDERKAEARFDAATQAAHKAVTAAGAK